MNVNSFQAVCRVTPLSRAYLLVASRVIVGVVMMAAGILKIGHIGTLIWEIEQYRILPQFAVEPWGFALPFIEIILGLLLVSGILIRPSAAVSGLLVMSFATAKISAMIRGLDIEICPCFGPMIHLFLGQSLAIDFVLLLMSVPLVIYRSEYLSLAAWLVSRIAGVGPKLDR